MSVVKFLDERDHTTVYVGLEVVANIKRNKQIGGWNMGDKKREYAISRHDTLRDAKQTAARRYG